MGGARPRTRGAGSARDGQAVHRGRGAVGAVPAGAHRSHGAAVVTAHNRLEEDGVKAYLITTGILFALFAVWHVLELASGLRSSATDSGFIIGVSLIILVAGGFSAWAFRLLRGMGRGAA